MLLLVVVLWSVLPLVSSTHILNTGRKKTNLLVGFWEWSELTSFTCTILTLSGGIPWLQNKNLSMDMKQKSSTNATCLKTLLVQHSYHCQYWCGIDLSLSQSFLPLPDPRDFTSLSWNFRHDCFWYGILRRINLQKVIDDFNQKWQF